MIDEAYLYQYLREADDSDAEATLDHLYLECGYELEDIVKAALEVGHAV